MFLFITIFSLICVCSLSQFVITEFGDEMEESGFIQKHLVEVILVEEEEQGGGGKKRGGGVTVKEVSDIHLQSQ